MTANREEKQFMVNIISVNDKKLLWNLLRSKGFSAKLADRVSHFNFQDNPEQIVNFRVEESDSWDYSAISVSMLKNDLRVSLTLRNNKKIINQTDDHEDMTSKIPKNAKLVLHFMLPKKYREDRSGDFEENFVEIEKEFGIKVARRKYWFDVLSLVVPYILKHLSRLATLGLGAALLNWVKTKIDFQ